MITAERTETVVAPLLEAYDAPYHIGAVALSVRDVKRDSAAFYRDAIGLSVLRQEAGFAELGVDGVPLVRLTGGAAQPVSQAGLPSTWPPPVTLFPAGQATAQEPPYWPLP